MRLLKALAIILLFAVPVQAQEEEIRSVISDQITAFLADDFVTAFTFAAPNIKQMFQTPERFGRMVANGYPMVHRPADYQFQALRDGPDGLHQEVLIRDGLGVYYVAHYTLVETENGWKISAVRIIKAPGVGA